ncbi:DUF2332 domain-containing protein [Angustibacter sp. Root456]|uniref:DUF2332 domain-containing protein n=1 Tax=Angustibacter sp. Root456 TaxID=1736539 RepID=UPI000B0A0002|nr:DUF2332 domain-containing protein [Angustibacter sp. Root456]
MTRFDDAALLSDRFRQHAAVCSSPLYAALMTAMADDWDAGGPVRAVCAGWEHAQPGSVVQLRLLAGLHRVVLRGEAPALAAYYRNVGGTLAPEDAWPVAQTVIADHVDELRDGLALAPQTNEVGRAAALAVGLADAVWRTGTGRVRLLEVGASAGLNLLVDRYAVRLDDGRVLGDEASPLLLDGAHGPVEPASFELVERRGCDLSPVDAGAPEGATLLSSYVWPDHAHRFERLQTALAIARTDPPRVEAASAGEWLEQVLAERPDDDVLTVVWQSITRMYWPAEELARVQAALDQAGRRLPRLAHVAMEYGAAEAGAQLTVDVWRGGAPDGARTLVAGVHDHGLPVTLHDGVRVG